VASLVENCSLNELGCGACRCLGIINVILGIKGDFDDSIGKHLANVNNDLVYRSLIGGLRDDGKFIDNAAAHFVKDMFNVTIEDPKKAVAQLSIGVKPRVKVMVAESDPFKNLDYYILYSTIGDLSNVLKYITSELGVDCGNCSGNVEYPKEPSGLVKLFESFINDCLTKLLPQFKDNACVALAFHTAQLTWRYLEAVSKNSSHELSGLLDRRELVERLGLQEIYNFSEYGMDGEWSLWGYPDCLTYDNEHGVSCLNVNKLKTIGGAVNKAVILAKAILNKLSNLGTRWFQIPEELLDGYVNQTLSNLKLEPYIMELLKKHHYADSGSYRGISIDYFDIYAVNLPELLEINKEKDYLKGGTRSRSLEVNYGAGLFARRHYYDKYYGSDYYNYLALSIDDDGIIHFGDFAARHVKVFFYDIEPLMFLRILNPVFIGNRVFNRVLLTSSYLKIPIWGG